MSKANSKISDTVRDEVMIQCEALFAKKMILDQIELLYTKGGKDKNEVLTKYGFLADAAKISELIHFKNLLAGIENDGVMTFAEHGRERGNWKYQEVLIKFNEQRAEYTRKIRDEYYKINKIIQVDRELKDHETTHSSPVSISKIENSQVHFGNGAISNYIKTESILPTESKNLLGRITQHPIVAPLIALIIVLIVYKLTGIDLNNIKDSFKDAGSVKGGSDSLVQTKSPSVDLPTVLITYPSFNSPVQRQTEATGTFKNIPTGSSLWLYVFSPRDNENRGAYYFDEITAINKDTSQWRIGKDRLYIGADKAKGYDYNLGVFVLDEQSAAVIRNTEKFNEIGFLKTDLPKHLECDCDQITVVRE